jgi:hypothetical protein
MTSSAAGTLMLSASKRFVANPTLPSARVVQIDSTPQHSSRGHARRGGDHILHRSHVVDKEVAVEPRNFFAHGGDHVRIGACTTANGPIIRL